MGQSVNKFLVLIVLLGLAITGQAAEQRGLLWEISAPGQSSSYLFGTIHSEDARVLALPQEVSEALQHSAQFVMEMEPSAVVAEEASRMMRLDNGQTLASLLDAPLYQQTVAVMARHGVPEAVTAQLKPWAVTMVLSMPKPNTGLFLDVALLQGAMAQNKQIVGLETAEEQLGTLDGMPMTMQVELLRHTLLHYAEIEPLTESLIVAWLQRDLALLERIAEESNTGLAREIEETIQARMVDERNRRMVERMLPLLQQQGSFVAVGALHLPGEQGIINLLRHRGYTVRPIY